MSADLVPRATSLSDIYHPEDVPAQAPRWTALTAAFEARYGHAPAFVSRAPGRVNIIGEHIDYSLYPVLPMAISADAILAVSYTPADPSSARTTFRIEIANLLGDKFPPATFDVPIEGDVEIVAADHHWGNYFKCGLSGALELLRRKAGGKAGVRPADMRVMMDGSVPVGGGLSSSAAFTTASALAVMFANGVTEVDKTELTELAIVSERGVGVNSGGMDQSASVFSTKHSALLVDFVPSLTVTPISFPATSPALTFLIAQSFVTSEKKITAPIHYNLRVAECSLAAAYLNAASNPAGTVLPADNSPLAISLRSFATAHLASNNGGDGSSPLESLIKTVEETLTKEEGYTREEIASVLGLSVPDLEARYMSKFPVRADRFRLRQRALHVFREARRVESFMRLLSNASSTTSSAVDALGGTPPDTSALNTALGDLLNETQASCRDMYECSCPEIDTICDVARRAGSYGSRLTGAGWGGSTVHLVAADKVEDVKAALRREYYDEIGITGSKLDEALVVSKPGSGTCLAVMSDFQSQ
ncbi:probable N-acetylgalactosamine kinase [Cephalotrichum gorgonifer]|uniref:Galactokinase n=1 Tax=Cephalotrichum gorgonifer TaxID=2041049 RepID=A0AAE8N0C1_9PEZI|nr:probable N-acetylgalactosamine kinase [Cephalotrichum gorgonifer]